MLSIFRSRHIQAYCDYNIEQHLLAAETSAVTVGAARCTPCPLFVEGCSPSPLAPSYASDAAADVSVPEDVGAASASAKLGSSKGKGGWGGGRGSGGGGGGSGSGGGGSSGGGGGSGTVGGSGGSGGGGGGSGGSGGSRGGGTGGGGIGARCVGFGGGQRQQQQCRGETPSPQQLREWFLRGASGGSCPYVIRTGDRAGQTCGRLHTQHRYFSRLNDAWRAEFDDDVELPHWADLLKSRIAIFDLDFDAILSAMYALSVSAEGDCYRCVPRDPGIADAALGASESGTLPGTAPAEALHTFTLDSGASRYFFRDSTTLTPLPAPIPVRLANPSAGPVVARSSTVLPCPAVPSGSLSGLHLPSFSTKLVSASGQVARLLLVSPPIAPDPSVAPPPGSPLPASPSWHALSSSCLWSSQVSASPPALACPALPPLRRGEAARRSSLLLVSPDDCSPADPPHGRDLPVLRLHSDRGGEFSSDLLREFCRGEGILQWFTLSDSPRKNGFSERRIGLVMKPTLRWTGEVGDASVFRVWGSRAFVRDTSADKLSPRVFLGFVPDAPGWQFYHPTSRRIFPSKDVTFDKSVPFYRSCSLRCVSGRPSPWSAPVQVAVESGAARGAASGGVASGGAEPGGAESKGAETGGAEPGGVETGGAEPGGVATRGGEPGGAASEGAESGGAEPQGAASSRGSAGASPSMSPQQLREWFVRRTRLRSGASGAGGAGPAGAGGPGVAAGAGVTGGTTTTGPGGARTRGTGAAATGGVEGTGAGDLTESSTTGAGGAGAGGAGVGGPGAGGAGVGSPGVGGAGAGGAGAVDPGGAVRPRPYFVPLLQQVLGTPPSAALTPPLLCPPPDQSQPPFHPASPLPAPSPYTEQSGSLTEHREPASRPVSPVCTAHRIPRSRPPLVPGTHAMTLRPSSVPLRVPLPAPPESSLLESASASLPSVGGECALGTDVLEDRQEDLESLTAAVPRFASMLLAPEGDPDAPDIPTPRSSPYSSQWQAAMDAHMASWKSTGTYVDEVPPPGANIVDGMWIFRVKRPPGSPPAFKARYVARGFSQRQGVENFQTFSPTPKMTTLWVLLHVSAQRDYELHSLDFSTTFLQGSLHEEILLCRPPGLTESFPAGTQWSLRRPFYGLRQAPCKWPDTLRTTLAALGFAPATADPSLFLRTDTSLPPFYVLVYVDDLVFATADTEALTLVKSELQTRHTCTDLGEMRSYLGLQITRDRARRTITLTQSHMVHQVLQRFGFQFSSPQPTPLSTSHSLSAPPSDESVEPSGPYPELVGCLMYLMTCTRPDLAYPLSLLARYVAPGLHLQPRFRLFFLAVYPLVFESQLQL
ncbi:unnamed protein product [Closterium sp. NIES-53]